MADITGMGDVLGVLRGVSGQTSQLQGMLGGATAQTKEAITEAEVANQQVIQNKGIIDLQQARGELEAQTNSRRAASAFGTNMSDMTQIVTKIGETMKTSAMQTIEQAKKVQEIDARSDLFSNPAGFIYDLMFGDAERDKLAASQATFEAASKTMQQLNQATQQTHLTQKAIAETQTTATIAAQEELIANQASLSAAAAKAKLAGADMQYINQADSLNARQASLAVQAYNIKATDEQRQWMRAAKEAQTKDEETLLDFYNDGARALGQATVTTMGGLRALMTANKGKVDYIISRGAELLQTDSTGIRVASNPFEALTVTQQFNIPMNPAQTEVAKKFKNELGTALQVSSIEELLVAQGADPKTVKRAAMEAAADKKQWPRLQQDWLALKAARDAQVIRVGDSSNIYAPPPLDFLQGKVELDNRPFLSKYIKPQVTAGGKEFNPNELLSFAAEASAKDKIPLGDIVADIVWMADQVKIVNNGTVGYHKMFGVDPMMKLVMPTAVDGGLFGSDVKNIDLSDPVAVTSRVQDVLSGQRPSKAFNTLQEAAMKSRRNQYPFLNMSQE